MQVSTIGVDLAKNVFQVHGVDSAGKVSSPVSYDASRSWTSLVSFPVAWSAWKPAEPLIIGHGKSPNSATPFV